MPRYALQPRCAICGWQETDWANAKGIFTRGLAYDDDHWRQAQKIIQQTKTSSMEKNKIA